ncbi:YbaN family protein [Terrihabitans rhizophilus]|uniref:YbaN family protein n=1 Tax=Terrihabitans rhizophilus TaxID=3092662 RepID=A0ABU4RNN8_9HYPH|nr:YbaN family protein [Terrihabitans sp. PJ23]MDX6805330.1 YbaN family protein [Terrihabitans sp. PJ23]
MATTPNPDPLRPLFFVAGWILLAIGVVGVVLPLLPGTIFLILAAACFSRSSPRFELWLLNHPQLGPEVVAWRRDGSISVRGKAFALSGMALSLVIVWFSGAPRYAFAITAVLLVASAIYVGTRPSNPTGS